MIEAGGTDWWKDPKNQVGNGPFIWTVNESDVKSDFIPNPNYWAGQPKYNLEYRYNADTAVVFNAYKNNELDIANLGSEDLKAAQADPVLSKELQKNVIEFVPHVPHTSIAAMEAALYGGMQRFHQATGNRYTLLGLGMHPLLTLDQTACCGTWRPSCWWRTARTRIL